ncbi:MAG: hypothetical protein ABR606_05210 [Vicinamibacterales bacterium]
MGRRDNGKRDGAGADYRAEGTLPIDDRRLRIALFFEVRRFALIGPERGDEMAYIRALLAARIGTRASAA